MRTALRLGLGFSVGVILLWIALRTVDMKDVFETAADVDLSWVAVGMTFYALAVVLRSVRWHRILSSVMSVSLIRTGEALMVGYAMNYVIPARIGEIIRADYCKRRMGGSRSLALGTIAVERLCDGIIVVGMLICGIFLLPSDMANIDVLIGVAISGTLLFGGAGLALYLLSSNRQIRWGRLAALVERRVEEFRSSLKVLRIGPVIGQVFLLSIPVWAIDSAGLWAMVRAAGVTLSISQTLMLAGVVSLSMVLPSAPGFLGTIQLAYVISMAAFGYAAAPAIVAATVQQIFCFGSITIIGGALLTYSYIGRPAHVSETDTRNR